MFDLGQRQAYRLIARLRDKGLVDKVEKGKYLLLGLEPERVLSNPLFIASHLVAPAYVSYWSALHFYGFTEQVPLTTFVTTTKKKRPVSFRGFRFRFVTTRTHKFFGYRREMVGDLPVVIADEAKAIVDSLDLPDYAGSGVGSANGWLHPPGGFAAYLTVSDNLDTIPTLNLSRSQPGREQAVVTRCNGGTRMAGPVTRPFST
jgi:predicted transcriptional regulator of viral defense system